MANTPEDLSYTKDHEWVRAAAEYEDYIKEETSE